ncbi:MAG: hypothetical protein K6F33_03090 [Bacteroidales bacterium]|nr:hypothetical protein [Bacteroidales bacterium]
MEDNVHVILCKKKKCLAILTNNVSDFASFTHINILPVNLGYLKSTIK